MSGRLQNDVMMIQRAVLEGLVDDDTDFNTLLLMDAATRRNSHIVPEDEVTVELVDIAELTQEHAQIFEKLPAIGAVQPDKLAETVIWVIGDFDESDGHDLLQAVAEVQQSVAGINLVLFNNPQLISERPAFSTLLYQLHLKGVVKDGEQLMQLLKEVPPTRSHIEFPSIDLLTQMEGYLDTKARSWYFNEHAEAGSFWRSSQAVVERMGLKPGQRALIVNGRVSLLISRIILNTHGIVTRLWVLFLRWMSSMQMT